MENKTVLTFDLEFWHNSKFLKKYLPQNRCLSNDYIKESIEPILNLLTQYNQKATFFVLGQIAEKYPKVIEKIARSGHEIASHGYSHKTLDEINSEEFENEITRTNQVIENITGRRPIGFRAPNFSLSDKSPWIFKILKKYDFKYDSSIHPLLFKKNHHYPLKELSPSLGGIYFRILPLWLYFALTKLFSKTIPPVVYFHPYELFDSAPKIESAPWLLKKVKYWGTKGALNKFKKLLKNSECISIEEYLNENPTD